MPFSGCTPSASHVRARYRTLIVSAFCMAHALSIRAQAPAQAPAAAVQPRTGAELISALRDRSPEVRAAAQKTLLAADKTLIAGILATGTNHRSREIAVKVVVRIGAKAVPALLGLLDDPQAGPLAGNALFQVIGAESSGRIPEMLACLRAKPAVARYCGEILVKLSGPKAASHAPLLAKALGDGDDSVRVYTAAALGRMGAGARAAVPALAKALADESSAVRLQAAKALGSMGAAAKPAAEALKKAAADPVAEVSAEARRALRRVRG